MTNAIEQLIADLNAEPPRELWSRLRPALFYARDGFPYEAIGLALLAQENLAPLWVEELEAFAQDNTLIGDDCVLHMHLIVMLAARHDVRAFKPMLALCQLDEDESEAIFGDFVTSVMGRALAAVSAGEIQPLLALANAQEVSIWIRSAALQALAVRAQEGDADRVDTARILLEWAEHEATQLKAGIANDIEVFNTAIESLCDLCYVEAEAAIQRWHEDELVDPMWHGDMKTISRLLRRDFAEVVREARERKQLYITDAAAELDGWVMFGKRDEYDTPSFSDSPQPYVRETPKIGRNEPCPCGSGKKYKKCCGAGI